MADSGRRETAAPPGENPEPAANGPLSTPIDPLRAMAAKDLEQNRRLSRKLSSARDQPPATSPAGPNKVTRFRFVVCTLGVISLSMSQMSRMVLNLSITQMVEPSLLAARDDASRASLDGSCPWPEGGAAGEPLPTSSAGHEPSLELSTAPATDSDGNLNDFHDLEEVWEASTTPATNGDVGATEPPLATTGPPASRAANASRSQPAGQQQVDRFAWDMRQQNMLLGGFFYSYFVFMVLGGRLAEIYGAKYVILVSVAGSALINLATPWMARTSFALLLASRVLMGAIQSGVFPGVYALIARWLTMSEASIYTPLIKMNLRLGMALGSLIPGLVSSWPQVFYLTGALNALWSVLWLALASSTPAESAWASEAETRHINRKKRLATRAASETSKRTPWLAILTAPSVVGLVVVKLTFNYAIDFLAIELPSYLKYVHHATKQQISTITTTMFLIQVLLIVFVGWLAKVLVQRRPLGLDKTAIRKLFQSAGSLGLAATFLAITFNDCSLTYVAVMLQLTSFLSMFAAGGETMLPYDLSEEYPATIMAIANSVANVSAITTTTLAALILGDQGGSYARWNILMYLIVGANLVGGAAFLLLVRAEPIDFEAERAKGNGLAKGGGGGPAQHDIELQAANSTEKPPGDTS